MKICTTCKVEKSLGEFYKSKKAKDGLESRCKECERERGRIYGKKYYANNKEKVKSKRKKIYWKDVEKTRAEGRAYWHKNRESLNEANAKWRRENKDYIKKASKKYYAKNKDKILKYQREWSREKYRTDPLFKLRENLRRLIHKGLERKSLKKRTKTRDVLGCDFNTLLNHLNNNPYGFKYGDENIDIDHIIPVSRAKDINELERLNHYTNLQLLPSEYNRCVKIDNDFDEDNLKEWLNTTGKYF